MPSNQPPTPVVTTSLSALFWEFAKVGLFTFGGGYAMIPIIEALCVTQRRWLTPEQMGQTIVIAESTPGPIAVNCATYVGFKQRRWLGALVATAGICLPSFIIIYLIAVWFQDFLSYQPVVHALAGVNIAVGLLVLQAGIKMTRQQKTPLGFVIVILALIALLLGEMHLLPLTCTAIMGGAVVISLGHYCASGQAATERTPPASANINATQTTGTVTPATIAATATDTDTAATITSTTTGTVTPVSVTTTASGTDSRSTDSAPTPIVATPKQSVPTGEEGAKP